jgi:hypothetical protein
MAFENVERCLELWDDDGPTLALKLFMTYYQFNTPESWQGQRNIDVEPDVDEIKQEKEPD